MCILFTQDSKRNRECPGASVNDLHVKGADALPTRKGVPAEGGDYRCGFSMVKRLADFLVITRSNKLLFASFAGCFHGLKRIIRTRRWDTK
ncbi:hypothetical protein ALC57_17304 [Trachymyrmex cornetzi]|uniref:Uncharacterized protein n=1 Tax=Trachymyrmex cornetzi TaxID=471704 RepID=A0A195DCY7_9HYME|nr:hypothetical protein ALC57_17304 [Trachymyrmex cornetzi]